MPLLNRKPFVRRDPPSNLQPTDKVFYLEITNEVFTEYEDYWARLVLCNAMVWTCELTGRPNLTFTEAVESEVKARKCLANIPDDLRKPLLYIATLTRRGRYADMSDDVFNYVRDRYFVGEEVEAIIGKHWYDCKMIRVVYPTEDEIKDYEEKMAESDEEEGEDDVVEILEVNKTPEKVDEDIEIVEVIQKKDKKKDEKTKDVKKREDEEDYPPFATFKYEVVELDAWDAKQPKKHIVSWEQIRRNKGVLTREKCKLFLKQGVQLSQQGFWSIKENVMKKYNLAKMSYKDVFPGNPPKFQETKSKKMPASRSPFQNPKKKEDKEETKRQKKEDKEEKKRQKKEAREKNTNGEIKKKSGRPPVTEEEKEQRRKMLEEEREQRKKQKEIMKEEIKAERREEIKLRIEKVREEKRKEKELKKEQRRLQNEYMKEWRRLRDDLECDDHKDLPRPTPVQCRIPDSLFSEFIMVLEFINVFAELLELKDVYPHGITFDLLEHALVEKEVAGVLNDVFQLLLQAVFTLQEEEDDEVEADTTAEEVIEADKQDISLQEAVCVANRAATWSQQYYGVPLQKVPLDALTLTEVLRLHILASGATNVANAQWRHLNRGGYKSVDDPGLLFKLEEPEIVKSLRVNTIFDVPMVSKLKILNVLIGQILTYASARDIIDDNIEKLKELKNKLRLHQFAQIKKERELNSARLQEKREKRQKEVEKRMKEAEKKAAALTMTGESDRPIELDLDEEEDEEEEEEDEEERAAKEEKEERNKEARKQDFLKREQELLQQVLNIAKGVNIAPLGQDRAYRRYWLFNSLPGLFVEDNEMNPGLCRLSPTPYDPTSNPDSESLEEFFKVQAEKNVNAISDGDKDEKNNSDKENESGNSPAKHVKSILNKTLLKVPNQNNGHSLGVMQGADSELKMDIDSKNAVNGEIGVELESSQSSEKGEETELSELDESVNGEPMPDIYGLCTADSQTCPVHSDRPDHHRWYFYHKTEDFHVLINSLNNRGYREKELRSNVECYKPTIECSIRCCPVYKLDPSLEPELEMMHRKSQRNISTKKDRDANLNFPPGTAIDEILQLTLRDMILETEEKIFLGMLGSIRAEDREAWREAIENGTYIRETELDFGGRKRISQLKSELGLEVNDEADSEDLPDNDEAAGAVIVKDLAQAILKIAQAIDTKYLTVPLGETDKARKSRERAEAKLKRKHKLADKGSDEEGSDHESEDDEEEEGEKKNVRLEVTDNALRTPMERWEKSLMASTNLSQLCLHYATLDNSITWSRSALNARCRICRRKADAEAMLLCDGCDKGYHIFCLKPILKSIPSGDWYCDKCKPKEKPKSPRKKQRQIYREESDDEEVATNSDSDESLVNEDKCYVCKRSGTLICCDTCPLSFHQECANLRKIPRGWWSCRQCQFPSDKKEPIEKKKKSKEKEKEKEKVKKVKDKEKNKENQKVKDSSNGGNKENKEKTKTPPSRSKSKKKGNIKEKSSNKTPSPTEKRKRSIGDTNTSPQMSKRPRLEETEQENTTSKRARRSLVNETCLLNTPALETVLEELLKHPLSWPFSKPVSKKDAPDYYDIVKKPMDFRTVHGKLFDMKYLKDDEFIADVMLVFQNCQQYNMEDTDEYKAGKTLSKHFTKRIQELGLNYEGERKKPAKKRKR